LNKIKGMASRLMSKFGGPSEIMENLDEKRSSSLPLFMKKKFYFALPPFINLLRRRNANGSNDKLIEKLEAMNTNLKGDVEEAKKKGFFAKTKEGFSNLKERFSNFTNRLTWKRGGKKNRRGKRKTSKKLGGGDEDIFAAIGWFVCLILCCATGLGCIICGPLLILSVCLGLGIDCAAGISAAAKTAPDVLPGTPAVPSEVGIGIGALSAYHQVRTDNAWIPGQDQSNDKYRQANAIQSVGNAFGGKRRSKRNKRKLSKKTRAHKK